MGLQLAATVGLGTWGGHWAESRWNFAPWGTLAGTLLGAAVGLTVFILDALKLEKKDKDAR